MTSEQFQKLLIKNPALRIGKRPPVFETTKRKSKLPLTIADNEHEIQLLVFKVLDANQDKYPDLKFIFAVPNGGLRHKMTAIRLKREGVRKGVLDVFVPFSRKGFSGLWIEHKYKYGKLQDEQLEFQKHVEKENYKVVVSRSEVETLRFIEDYLDIKLLN